MKHIIKITLAVLIVTFMIFDESKAEVLEKGSKLYDEVIPIAIALKDAVINKQVDVLISYSNSDPLYSYAEYLSDKNSEEYKYLYDDAWNEASMPRRKSVYKILRTARKLEIILEQDEIRGRNIITAYFYDKESIKLKIPLDRETAMLWGKEFITCRFINTKEGWKVAYSIFDYGTDDILH